MLNIFCKLWYIVVIVAKKKLILSYKGIIKSQLIESNTLFVILKCCLLKDNFNKENYLIIWVVGLILCRLFTTSRKRMQTACHACMTDLVWPVRGVCERVCEKGRMRYTETTGVRSRDRNVCRFYMSVRSRRGKMGTDFVGYRMEMGHGDVGKSGLFWTEISDNDARRLNAWLYLSQKLH